MLTSNVTKKIYKKMDELRNLIGRELNKIPSTERLDSPENSLMCQMQLFADSIQDAKENMIEKEEETQS